MELHQYYLIVNITKRTKFSGNEEIKGEKIMPLNITYTIQRAMLLHDSVSQCIVLDKRNNNGTPILIAYVVSSNGNKFSPKKLKVHLKEYLQKEYSIIFVQISAIPLTSEGDIDLKALEEKYVIEPNIITKWKSEIEDIPNVQETVVLARPSSTKNKVLHINDLLVSSNIVQSQKNNIKTVQHPVINNNTKYAYNNGGELIIPKDYPLTFTQAFLQTVQKYANKGIRYINHDGKEELQTYEQLFEKAKCILHGLRNNNILPGNPVILQIKRLNDYFSVFWGCVLGGIIPVTVAVAPAFDERNGIIDKLCGIWQLLNKPPIVTSSDLCLSLKGLERIVEMNGIEVLSVDELKLNHAIHDIYYANPDEILFYQLTSGSTGIPKCIQETHCSVVCHIIASQQHNNYCEQDITLNWLPMDHVVPILTFHLKDIYLGCNQIEVPTEIILSNPLNWLDYIEAYNVTHSWSPNFGFKLVSKALKNVEDRIWDLSSMKFFMNAGEQVTLPVIKEFLDLTASYGIRENTMQPAFGMAEVCTCMTYNNNFHLTSSTHYIKKDSLSSQLEFVDYLNKDTISFIDLGAPVPGVEIRITDEKNQLLPEGVIGRFQIRGSVVTPGYLKNDKANAEAFVGSGWFNSGDLGFIKNGSLTLTGREKEVIIIHGANFYCYEIEDIVNEIEGVIPTYSAACGINNSSGSETLIIFYTPHNMDMKNTTELIREIRKKVTAGLGINPAYIIPISKNDFPKTTSGKIQRSLLKQSFIRGEFENQLKEIDIYLETINTIPDWFLEQDWVPKRLMTIPYNSNAFNNNILILYDKSTPFGIKLIERLKTNIKNIIAVEVGNQFSQKNASCYTINVYNEQHVTLLFDKLFKDNIQLSHILYLPSYDKVLPTIMDVNELIEGQKKTLTGLLFLVKAINSKKEKLFENKFIHLITVSSYANFVLGQKELNYAKAVLPGWIKTIEQEFPYIKAYHVDLDNDSSLEKNVQCLKKEILYNVQDQDIAYRAGKRLIRILKPKQILNYCNNKVQSLPFKKGGLYLITGGLGGIGLKLSHYLLKHYDIKLIIIGNSSLGVVEKDIGDIVSHQPIKVERMQAFQSLTLFKGQVQYFHTDVCNREELEKIISQVKNRWNMYVDGIIHLAGILSQCDLIQETPENLKNTLLAKSVGTWNLYNILEKQGRGLFINFSSINGVFGGTGVASYSAANSFVNTFSAFYNNTQNNISVYCFIWSMWDETGMSKGYFMKELLPAKGYYLISAKKGLNSFLIALKNNLHNPIIGLNKMHPSIQRYFSHSCKNIQELICFYTSHSENNIEKDIHLNIKDSFGTPVQYRLKTIDKMPVDEFGTISKTALLRQLNYRRSLPMYQASKMEHMLITIWQETLNVPLTSMEDSFIELGGDSISAIKINSRINSRFGVELSMAELYQYATIPALCNCIQKKLDNSTENAEADRAHFIEFLKNNQNTRNTDSYPLSFAQEALWEFEKQFPQSWLYNMPLVLQINGLLNFKALEYAFKGLIKRHAGFRSVFFEKEGGTPYQKILNDMPITIKVKNLEDVSQKEIKTIIKAEEQRKLDITTGPLIRVTLLRLSNKIHLLLLTIHHIVFDGWSYEVIFKDISYYYNDYIKGRFIPLESLPLKYVDFIQWEREYALSTTIHNQLKYWERTLSNLELHEIPCDYEQFSHSPDCGSFCALKLKKEITQKLKQLCFKYQLSIFTVILSIFDLTIYQSTNQRDVAIGTIVATRKFRELENLTGFFINAVVLRSDLNNDISFKDLMFQNKQVITEAFSNKEVSFGQVIQLRKSKKVFRNNPFYQAMIVLQPPLLQNLKLNNLEIERYTIGYDIARADVVFELQEENNELFGGFYYNTNYFKYSTIQCLKKSFEYLASVVTPELKIESMISKLRNSNIINNY
jgi:acyl-CoA synthetase (AMP-forming)/AMP-acid ligase II/NADP-dependent 3-hydroxy acid dehydrogenase YdfG/acyl carrier protein